MNASGQAVKLFQAGTPLREIGVTVGLDTGAVAVALTRSGRRPQVRRSVTYQVRVCPFFDICRECTFQGCVLDRFKVLTT